MIPCKLMLSFFDYYYFVFCLSLSQTLPELFLFLFCWLSGHLFLSIAKDAKKKTSCDGAKNYHRPKLLAGNSTPVTRNSANSNQNNYFLC